MIHCLYFVAKCLINWKVYYTSKEYKQRTYTDLVTFEIIELNDLPIFYEVMEYE